MRAFIEKVDISGWNQSVGRPPVRLPDPQGTWELRSEKHPGVQPCEPD